jgi:ferredoxin--NADP+ reductase
MLMARVLENKEIAPNVFECTVSAREIAAKVRPGQFIIIIPDEYSERTPVTVADWDAGNGTITFVFLAIGSSTVKIAELSPGEDVYSLTGPLGKAFEIEQFGRVALVGGCYGIGGIYPAARALKACGNEVICYSEARSNFLLYWDEKLEEIADEVKYATADASKGFKGHAHDQLQADLEGGTRYDRLLVVGCTFMMYRISEITRPYGLKTIVSMNPIMIDGTGMCGACRIEVGGTTRFACVDGPHFDGHLVDWDLILARRKAYLEEEIVSQERKNYGEGKSH